MKTTLKQIWNDGLVSLISKAQWDFIKFTNALALLSIITLLVVSMPEPDAELTTWLLVGALQLAIVLTVHVRADRIEKKMIEIDEENDQRDNNMRTHIELVYQDVRWLVHRELLIHGGGMGYGFPAELADAGNPGDPDHPDFVGPPRPEFNSRDITS